MCRWSEIMKKHKKQLIEALEREEYYLEAYEG